MHIKKQFEFPACVYTVYIECVIVSIGRTDCLNLLEVYIK